MSRDTLDLKTELNKIESALRAAMMLEREILALHTHTGLDLTSDRMAGLYTTTVELLMRRAMLRARLELLRTETLTIPGAGKSPRI